jgi:hypothetical protein
MIPKSKIYVENLGFFMLSHVTILPKQSTVPCVIFFSLYNQFDYLNILKYKHNISMYSMCMNGYVLGNFNRKKRLLIDGHPQSHGNIAEFINSCSFSLFSANYSFGEYSNDKELFMKWKTSIFVVVHAIHIVS